ncbi:MAG: hypothetical protein DIZ80_05400 [endosymbiont of Galathealinum brachiosum]|uniref:Lytic murein transglycosylase n=1 Tax=endosymbiont of Galathealinum brachiosum TaxID=2200906 RepID=A0A370DJ12_9GAMM|nr:MAG: hypothetical protein DIZ80_05400 [endosymbiont of Galathealinum brachiosum]
MNRTFLIFLMIGTAMMIAVIGQHEPTAQLDTMPWEVDKLKNGSLRVFGITLGKTSIQDANQIFASFAETRLQITTDSNDYKTYQLIANYNELIIGGLITKITLTYQLNQDELEEIANSVKNISNTQRIQFHPIDNKTEMRYLNTAISTITYIPSVDYGLDTIRQNFGMATEEKPLDEDAQLWIYPEMGLHIHIYKNKLDRFVYAPLK